MFSGHSYAGFLAGNSLPYVDGTGIYAFKLNTSTLMVSTPFSVSCLTGKYAISDLFAFSAKAGIGTVDYSTVTGIRATTDPQIIGGAIEYMLSGNRNDSYQAFICEYESVYWSINRKSNDSAEVLLAMDFSSVTAPNTRTRYRIGMHNFNAGYESEEKITTSVKYSLSTEIEYSFSRNFKGSLEGSIYFGDPVGGIIAAFGFGITIGS